MKCLGLEADRGTALNLLLFLALQSQNYHLEYAYPFLQAGYAICNSGDLEFPKK